MGNTFGQLFRINDFRRIARGRRGRGHRRLPAEHRTVRKRKSNVSWTAAVRAKVRLQPSEKKQISAKFFPVSLRAKRSARRSRILVRNKDARPEEYAEIAEKFRPSHADFTYEAKYGIRNWQGGGRASARETIGRVAAGAVAKKILSALYAEFEIVAYVAQILRSRCEN